MKILSHYAAALASALALFVVLGCSDGTPSVSSSTTEATVKGTVTIKGKLAKKGAVVFDPSNYARKHEQPRSAPINKDGTYSIKTLIGTNSVRVSSPEAEAASSGYTNETLEVASGEQTFNIKLPRE
jgi:hypothetical protein